MDILISVLTTLGVDNTLWIQFAISVLFLILARLIFVNDLMRVLTDRVLNTSGATNEAEKIQLETLNSKKRYEKLLNDNILELNNNYSENKKKIKDQLETESKSKEEKIIESFKNEILKKQNEFIKVQEAVDKNSNELSVDLLAKIKQ